MKAIKSLLAASVLTAVAGANAAVINLTGTLDSQTPPFGTQTLGGDLSLTGEIDVNLTSGVISSFWIETNGSYTSTSSLGPVVTFYAGSRWTAVIPTGGRSVSSFTSDGAGGFIATYNWGAATTDSNGGSTFSASSSPTCNGHAFCSYAMAGSPGHDTFQMIINLDSGLAVTGVQLITQEVGAAGNTTSNYSLEEVPLPAAAWLFGSGLIGLVGAARRRLSAAQA